MTSSDDKCLICASDEGYFLDVSDDFLGQAKTCQLESVFEDQFGTRVCHKCTFEAKLCCEFLKRIDQDEEELDDEAVVCVLCRQSDVQSLFDLSAQRHGFAEFLSKCRILFADKFEVEKSSSVCLECRYCVDVLSDLRKLNHEIKLNKLSKVSTKIVSRKTTRHQSPDLELQTPSDTDSELSMGQNKKKAVAVKEANKLATVVHSCSECKESVETGVDMYRFHKTNKLLCRECWSVKEIINRNLPKKVKDSVDSNLKTCKVLLKDVGNTADTVEPKKLKVDVPTPRMSGRQRVPVVRDDEEIPQKITRESRQKKVPVSETKSRPSRTRKTSEQSVPESVETKSTRSRKTSEQSVPDIVESKSTRASRRKKQTSNDFEIVQEKPSEGLRKSDGSWHEDEEINVETDSEMDVVIEKEKTPKSNRSKRKRQADSVDKEQNPTHKRGRSSSVESSSTKKSLKVSKRDELIEVDEKSNEKEVFSNGKSEFKLPKRASRNVESAQSESEEIDILKDTDEEQEKVIEQDDVVNVDDEASQPVEESVDVQMSETVEDSAKDEELEVKDSKSKTKKQKKRSSKTPDKSDVDEVIPEVQLSENEAYVCKTCQESFENKYQILQHELSHDNAPILVLSRVEVPEKVSESENEEVKLNGHVQETNELESKVSAEINGLDIEKVARVEEDNIEKDQEILENDEPQVEDQPLGIEEVQQLTEIESVEKEADVEDIEEITEIEKAEEDQIELVQEEAEIEEVQEDQVGEVEVEPEIEQINKEKSEEIQQVMEIEQTEELQEVTDIEQDKEVQKVMEIEDAVIPQPESSDKVDAVPIDSEIVEQKEPQTPTVGRRKSIRLRRTALATNKSRRSSKRVRFEDEAEAEVEEVKKDESIIEEIHRMSEESNDSSFESKRIPVSDLDENEINVIIGTNVVTETMEVERVEPQSEKMDVDGDNEVELSDSPQVELSDAPQVELSDAPQEVAEESEIFVQESEVLVQENEILVQESEVSVQESEQMEEEEAEVEQVFVSAEEYQVEEVEDDVEESPAVESLQETEDLEEENTGDEALAQESLEDMLQKKGLQIVDEVVDSVTDESEKELNRSSEAEGNEVVEEAEEQVVQTLEPAEEEVEMVDTNCEEQGGEELVYEEEQEVVEDAGEELIPEVPDGKHLELDQISSEDENEYVNGESNIIQEETVEEEV